MPAEKAHAGGGTIPHLPPEHALDDTSRAYLTALKQEGFRGDIHIDQANRLVNATDNSIYQCIPQAVIAPKSHEDVSLLARLAAEPHFQEVYLTPRGGGTGTNGQSLNHGIAVDFSRYLTNIPSIEPETQRVTVQPGVILDQLNDALTPHGLFFPPTLSPSNRATLGGMVATDACGKGSRIYGKTSDYIESLTVVFADGSEAVITPLSPEALTEAKTREGLEGEVYRTLDNLITDNREEIRKRFPQLGRTLSGYNLAELYDEDRRFRLHKLIAGSEGTLAMVTEITFRVIPIPRYKKLIAISYGDFDAALRHGNSLLAHNPLAVETVDDVILGLARNDIIWHKVAHMLAPEVDDTPVAAINYVEFAGHDEELLQQQAQALCEELTAAAETNAHLLAWHVTGNPDEMRALWELRKRGVGLLGNVAGDRRPVPFVEDTAVPSERLADYIQEFRTLLQQHGLSYGMFGHIDAGCLHVRPALDLTRHEDDAFIRRLSDEVTALVKRYGGVLWGEHGKGFRAEFTPEFIGQTLFDACREIKRAFDPYNQLNPGKLAVPAGSEAKLTPVDDVPLRGSFDRQIPEAVRHELASSVRCNGNGACFNYQPTDAMCPSYKITRDRRHSPKGRAGLMREWLRQLSQAGYDIEAGLNQRQGWIAGGGLLPAAADDFSREVYDAMQGCLACKSCTGSCPVKVDIPDLKSRFLALYHTRYRRPLRDYLIRYSEEIALLAMRTPQLTNALLAFPPIRWFLERAIGLVDSPKASSPSLKALMHELDLKFATPATQSDETTVILVPEAFLLSYDTEALRAAVILLQTLGYTVCLAPPAVNGKAKHVKGFLSSFRRSAQKQAERLQALAATGLPLIGLDASITLAYRQEYPQYLGPDGEIPVRLLAEWLDNEIKTGKLNHLKQSIREAPAYHLFTHCTEQTNLPSASQSWQHIFMHFGLALHLVDTGCCGMAGSYGHEREHQENSQGLFDLSWRAALEEAGGQALATGFSCRHQARRFSGARPPSPAEALLRHL